MIIQFEDVGARDVVQITKAGHYKGTKQNLQSQKMLQTKILTYMCVIYICNYINAYFIVINYIFKYCENIIV